MRARGALPLLLSALLPAAALASGGAGRIALLPPEVEVAEADAGPRVAELLAAALAARGWEVASGEEVERALFATRLRRTDSIPSPVRDGLFGQLDVSAVLLSRVGAWLGGRDPVVVLTARLVGLDGRTAWAEFQSLTGAETADPFDLRRAATVEEVARRAVERLCANLPAPGAPAPRRGLQDRPFYLSAPAVFRSRHLGAPVTRVTLVPFSNLTRVREAPRTAGAQLERLLEASGAFEVVEPADFRDAMRAEAIPSLLRLQPDQLRAIGARLGSPVFVRGTVWRWIDTTAYSGALDPEVELEIELVDVGANRVLGVAHVARTGSDYSGFLLRGRMRTAAALAERVVAEIVEALLAADPVGAKADSPERPDGSPPAGPNQGEGRP